MLIGKLKKLRENLISDRSFSEILTGSAWALGASVLSSGLAMIISIIIVRIYGAEIMGTVAIITNFLNLATIFTIMGTNTSILRLIPEHMVRYSATSAFRIYRKTQYFVTALSIVVGALLFLLSGPIAGKVFSKPHLSFFLRLASIFALFLSLMNLNTSAVRGLRLVRAFALMQLLPNASKLFFLMGITFLFFDPYNPLYAQFAAYLFTALMGALIIRIEFKKKIQPHDIVSDMPVKDILSISYPMLMTAAMSFLIGQTGVLMLGIFRSETQVGYYDIAVKLATLTAFVLNAINAMAAPKFSELFHSNQMEELIAVARKSAKFIFWTTAPILSGLVVFGKPVLSVLFGPDFTTAYIPMVLLVVGQFVNSISGSTGYFMNMTGNQNAFRNIIFVAAVLNVGFNLIVIPPLGIIGAALSGMVSLMVWNIAALVFIKYKYGKIIGYFPHMRSR